ncbi:TonB-dependent siderophore receptor [Rheinheimera sediminis]|uniref:TonB-dependent siderophore receptor n=1 Tax=Rheinheimera sp. YQF-1 TaxID=2499626 RepID=UPI000FD968A1|nr:TonB-dependent siderophore receptor [Rheinheimera sp. YQF-1]RVT41394.1 TonB-dependent siderophore receptor [Rheinheimera sp. YQF-1]
MHHSHPFRILKPFAIAVLPALISQLCWAETVSDSKDPLEHIRITASSELGADVGLKMPTKITELPQSITIIDNQRLDVQNLVTLDDVMLYSPGITVQPGTSLRTAYYSRGFSIDSMSFDGITTSGWNEAINTEDMAIYQRVELLRGASGLLQGTGNPSGTINLVRKRPTENLLAEAKLTIGSWNTYRGEADVSGSLNENNNIKGRFIAIKDNRDYFYEQASRDKSLLYATTEWNVSEQTVIALTTKYQDTSDDGISMGLPRYSDGRALNVSRSTNAGAGWGERNWQNYQHFLEVKHVFNDSWQGKVSVSRIDGDSDLIYASFFGAVNEATSKSMMFMQGAYDFDNQETDFDAYVTGSYDVLEVEQNIVVGANYWDAESGQTSYSLAGVSGNLDINTYDPSDVSTPTSKNWTGEQITSTRQYGGYFANRSLLTSGLTLIVGARASWWDTDVQRRSEVGGPTVPTGQYELDSEVTPYGGIVYDINDNISFYSSYTSIFKPQNYVDAAGDVLNPMTGSNKELGLKGSFYQGKLYGAISGFKITQKDRAQVDPNAPCSGGSDCVYIANGIVESQGFDVDVSGQLDDNLQLQAGYTWLDTEYVQDRNASGTSSNLEGTAYSSFTPHHLFKLWLHYRPDLFTHKFSIGAGMNSQSEYYVDSGTIRMTQGGYTTFNADAQWEISPTTQLALNVKNLFDKHYLSRIGAIGWNNWYGEPLNVQLSLRVKL